MNLNDNTKHLYFTLHKVETWSIEKYITFRLEKQITSFTFSKQLEHSFYQNYIKRKLNNNNKRAIYDQLSYKFTRDIKAERYMGMWDCLLMMSDDKKERAEGFNFCTKFFPQFYNFSSQNSCKNIGQANITINHHKTLEELEWTLRSGNLVKNYLDKFLKDKGDNLPFNLPEVSNIIECSEDSLFKKHVAPDDWNEMNTTHPIFNFQLDNEVDAYLTTLIDYIQDPTHLEFNNLPKIPRDTTKPLECYFYRKVMKKLIYFWKTIDNYYKISEGHYIIDTLHDIVTIGFKILQKDIYSYPIDITSMGSKERKNKSLKDKKNKTLYGHRVDVIIRDKSHDLCIMEIVCPFYRTNKKKDLWDFRRGARVSKDTYDKIINKIIYENGNSINAETIFNIIKQLEISYLHVHGRNWSLWSLDHPGNQIYRIKKNIEFKFPTKPKYKDDIYKYFKSMWELANRINQVSMFLSTLSATLNSSDNLITNKANFADILKATCSTTSTTPIDTPTELSITPLEANRVDQKLYEFIHYMPLPVEWCTPDNSEYESEEYDSEDGKI